MNSSACHDSVHFGPKRVRPLAYLGRMFAFVLVISSFPFTSVGTAHGQTSLTSQGAGASNTPRLPERADQFCKKAAVTQWSGSAEETQAKQFAKDLCDSYFNDKPFGPITSSKLSSKAAQILADKFRQDLVGALSHKGVIGPAEIMSTFLKSVTGEQAWRRMPLVSPNRALEKSVKDAPWVILPVAEHDALTRAITESTSKAESVGDLKKAYKKAYKHHDDWYQAIKPYLVEKE